MTHPLAAQDVAPTANDYGQTGLIEMPTAWALPDGHVRLGAAIGQPYRHVFAGFAPLPRLEATLRHSDPTFDLGGAATDELAVDVKFVLVRETATRPQVVVGARQVFGDGPLAGEYVAASKRVRWLDVTVGIGWGRYAGRGGLPNPFGRLGDRGDPRRPEDGSSLDTLFAGEEIGLFAGLEARLPVPGLSALVEYSPDDFAFERARDPDLDRPVPVNVGLSWRPVPWLTAGVAVEQGEAVIGRIALGFDPGRLPTRRTPRPPPPVTDRAEAPPAAEVTADGVLAALAEAGVRPRAVRLGGTRAEVWVDRDPAVPAATQAGRAARALTGAVPAPAAELAVTLGDRGLDVSRVALLRGDLERAARHAGSPEELWRGAAVTAAAPPADAPGTGSAGDFAPRFELWGELRGEVSVADAERDTLYRVSLLAEGEARPWPGLVIGAAGRIAIADSLVLPARRITQLVRSDRALLADHDARLERAYVGQLWRLREDVFARVATGYLEEAYAGTAGELLWRPFGRRYAVGARAAYAVRRDFDSQIALFPLEIVTGHLDLYYRPPLDGLETRLSAGRYLAGDVGVTGEIARRFDNGVRIGAHLTATDGDGSGTPRLSGGLRVSIPLYVLDPVAPRSRATLRVEPLLRDTGQQLDAPLGLYELTSPLAYDAVAGAWTGVLD